MTEAEWLAATDTTPMLRFLRGKASDRKLRLLAAISCRRIRSLMDDERRLRAVEVAEQYADGVVGQTALDDARQAVLDWGDLLERQDFPGIAYARVAATLTRPLMTDTPPHEFPPTIPAAVREIFGNPFRPVTSAPSWLTSDVLGRASGIYRECAFDRMPILADALMDAGCDNEDMLCHCRSNELHVRGCWVIDLLLGKE